MPSGFEASPQDMAAGYAKAARQVGTTDPGVRGADWQTAVVTAVGTDGTVDIGNIRARRLLDAYPNPTVGDLIAITQNSAGNWIALGELAPPVSTEWTAYTPVVTGAGTATWSLRTGWWKRLGGAVFIEAYIAFNAAGTGTGTVTVTLPAIPYRGAANIRQRLSVYAGGIVAGTNTGVGGQAVGLIQGAGTGALLEQLRGPTDILLRGDNFSATATLTINGWYREI